MPVSDRLTNAARELGRERARRARPSPSSISACTRQVWFSEHDVPVTNTPDGETYLAQETGRMSEELLANVVARAGYGVLLHPGMIPDVNLQRELTEEECRRISVRGGEVDGFILVAPEYRTLYGAIALIEFKRKSLWAYLDLVRKGTVLEGQPGDYEQAQCYLAALQTRFPTPLTHSLYIAANLDRSMLTAFTTGKYARPKMTTRPAGIFEEWVEYNPDLVHSLALRAEAQTMYMAETTAADVPRKYDPVAPDWQCAWCEWHDACLEAGNG